MLYAKSPLLSEKIIIELDGAPHGEYIQIVKDMNRTAYLESLGFRVIRFENKLVFQDPEYVQEEIKKAFKLESTTPAEK